MKNIGIYRHMDAAEFEVLFYKYLSEIPFKDQIIHTKIIDEDFIDWTITDYLFTFWI